MFILLQIRRFYLIMNLITPLKSPKYSLTYRYLSTIHPKPLKTSVLYLWKFSGTPLHLEEHDPKIRQWLPTLFPCTLKVC